MKKISIFFLVFLFTASANAQQQFSGWLASFNTYKLDKKLSLHFDAQLRSTDELQHVQTVLLRPGLNVHFSKKVIGSFGYGFIQNRRMISNVTGEAVENRVWQQLLVNQKIKNISSAHRFRLEQRFLPVSKIVNNTLQQDGNKYANRFRYFTRNVIPLNHQKTFSKGLFAGIQDELFFNVGNASAVNGKTFDQNRLFLSIGYRISPKMDIETGYMNQYISGRNNNFINNHILQIGAYTRF
jgi:hypothetical protein